MYCERVALVVDRQEWAREVALAAFRAAGQTTQPGVLAHSLRYQSEELVDEDNVRITLVHEDLYETHKVSIDVTPTVALRPVVSA